MVPASPSYPLSFYHPMTAYHPHVFYAQTQPYVSFNPQRDTDIDTSGMYTLFPEVVNSPNRMNAHTSFASSHIPTSVTGASSFASDPYALYTQSTPAPSIHVIPAAGTDIAFLNGGDLTHVDMDSSGPNTQDMQLLELALLNDWTRLNPEVSFQPVTSDPYSSVLPGEVSSPMAQTYGAHVSVGPTASAPHSTAGSHSQPQVPSQPRPSPSKSVVVGPPCSPSTSGSRRPSPRLPRRPLGGSPREESLRQRACIGCKRGKAKCESVDPNDPNSRCTRCVRYNRPCEPVEPKPLRQASTIKEISQQIRDLEVKIQHRLEELCGSDGTPLLANEPSEGRRCTCPVPATSVSTSVSEEASQPPVAMIHRAGCPASDPMGLYSRALLMELQDPESKSSEDDEDDGDFMMSSEEEDKYHDLLNMPIPSSGTPAATFYELAQSLGSPGQKNTSLPTDSQSSTDVGLAGANYFTPNPAARPTIRRIVIERERLPSYLVNGTVKPSECIELFDRFIKYWNVSVSVLDPGLHTSARAVLWRCPFLFTVVLAVAARDFRKPEFYPILMQEAKTMAGQALMEWKSIEIVQAFILLATFPAPYRRWDEDRTWMYLGIAIRMAADLQLNRPIPANHTFPSEMAEREHLNRIRTWLICHNLDVSTAAKLGKVTTIQEDPVILGSRTWWRSSEYNSKFDVHLCAFTQIMMIFHKYFRLLATDSNSLYGYNNHVDVNVLVVQFTKEIENFQADFERIFDEESDPDDAACRYRAHVRYTAHYFRLVIYSICHRRACAQGARAGDPILVHCLDAASRLVKALSDHHANSVYFKYSAEGWFTFGAFAAAFMVKVMRPAFAPVIDHTQRQHLRSLVMELIDAYKSEQVSIDERHTPSIYARFLTRLLTRADELNAETPEVAAQPQAHPSRASPPVKIDVDEMDQLFGIPSPHSIP